MAKEERAAEQDLIQLLLNGDLVSPEMYQRYRRTVQKRSSDRKKRSELSIIQLRMIVDKVRE